VKLIESITPKMISEFVRQLLNSKPSLAAYGDSSEDLNYDHLVARYDGEGQQAAAAAAAAGGSTGSVFTRLFGPAGAAVRGGR